MIEWSYILYILYPEVSIT